LNRFDYNLQGDFDEKFLVALAILFLAPSVAKTSIPLKKAAQSACNVNFFYIRLTDK
jgi:hypothetical protein